VKEYLADPEFCFRYETSHQITKILQKIFTNKRCKPIGEIMKTTSGVGAKKAAITATRKNQRQIEIIRGRSVQKYSQVNTFYFEFKPDNISGRTVDRSKLGVKEKILLRKTGYPIYATYDSTGIYPEQSLYFLYGNHSNCSLKYITAILNSKLFQFVYINRLVTTKNSTPHLKKVDLDRFPIYLCGESEKTRHDHIVRYVNQILWLHTDKNRVRLPSKIKQIGEEIRYYEEQIDQIVYQLYGLTDEEIKMIEKESGEKDGHKTVHQ
jgi:hypothetical protein